PVQISQQVNRVWVDDLGRSFVARLTAAYDYDYGVAAFDNNTLVNAVANGHPLLFANETHATVITSVAYALTTYHNGVQTTILNAVMFDPWPGVGERTSQSGELMAKTFGGKMRYLALAQIQSY